MFMYWIVDGYSSPQCSLRCHLYRKNECMHSPLVLTLSTLCLVHRVLYYLTGKIRDTGVRYADIAGLDHILVEMKEIQKMLLDDPAYVKVGAKCPRVSHAVLSGWALSCVKYQVKLHNFMGLNCCIPPGHLHIAR